MQTVSDKKQQQLERKTAATLVTIPVVVHIVLPDPSIVTNAQVLSQIAVLNADYTGGNADTSQLPAEWKQLLGDMSVQFCLAQRTPGGDPSSGIVRVTTTHGPFNGGTDAGAQVKYASNGGSDAWDPEKYLNIWVCHLAGNLLGVATLPDGSFPAAEQGVVILYTAFGTTGTASGNYNGGRTTTHEIGHYFSLRHIWGDDDSDGSISRCTQDDGVDDTPLQGRRTYGCPSTFPQLDNCTNTSPGFMFMNYMDYTDDDCMHLFTEGQTSRMRTAMETLRPGLLTSDGCQPVTLAENDASVTAITAPGGQLCDSRYTPVVWLRNRGSKPLSRVQIAYTVDGGTPQNFNWTGNLASLQQVQVQLPVSTAAPGTHTIKAYSYLPNQVTDGKPQNDTAGGNFRYYADAVPPLMEGFEGSTFPPEGWEIKNPDESLTWELTGNAAKTGSRSIVMRNLAYSSNGPVDDLYTPVINAQGADSLFLFFDVAAAVQTNPVTTGNVWDSLQVLITADCGQTFDSVYGKWGGNLITRTTPISSEFVPAAGEWRRDSVNLTPFIAQGRFRVVFRSITNFENNIYLDNINLVAKAVNPYLKEQGYTVAPNPTSSQVFVTFLEPPADLDAIAVYNAAGQLIARQAASAIDNSNRFTFDLVNEPNGVYFVKLIYRNRAKTIKIIKVR